jgi:hypothetical protein
MELKFESSKRLSRELAAELGSRSRGRDCCGNEKVLMPKGMVGWKWLSMKFVDACTNAGEVATL